MFLTMARRSMSVYCHSQALHGPRTLLLVLLSPEEGDSSSILLDSRRL